MFWDPSWRSLTRLPLIELLCAFPFSVRLEGVACFESLKAFFSWFKSNLSLNFFYWSQNLKKKKKILLCVRNIYYG